MTAYHNEIDPYAAQWLRNLIEADHIAPGDVDERSIADVRPDDLKGYSQCHFFAGIGVWSHSLRKAGWPDDRPVWTGSCPCQPFSAAGPGIGVADERHLWPHWHHLIRELEPDVVLGEQVASKDGLSWFDIVQTDLEAMGYAVGVVDTCSAGSGAPHIRQRLRFVAKRVATPPAIGRNGGAGSCDREQGEQGEQRRAIAPHDSEPCGLADSTRRGRSEERSDTNRSGERGNTEGVEQRTGGCRLLDHDGQPGATNGFWRDADWLFCRDGKWRPVEPGTFPLAHGIANRVGKLRAYGNAVDAEATRHFVEAVMECWEDLQVRTKKRNARMAVKRPSGRSFGTPAERVAPLAEAARFGKRIPGTLESGREPRNPNARKLFVVPETDGQ